MKVTIYGRGHVATTVAMILSDRAEHQITGPLARDRRRQLSAPADVVVLATASFLKDIADDLRAAVNAGANVITTCEEAAYPWAVNDEFAAELDQLAIDNGVSILGAGINPGFAFDYFVLTALGIVEDFDSIQVERVVNLSGFSLPIQRQLGIGFSSDDFEAGLRNGNIHGHIGFPQSMRIVARQLGLTIDRIEREIHPLILDESVESAGALLNPGQTGGFIQHYVGVVADEPWFTADFTGHVDLSLIGRTPSDKVQISGPDAVSFETQPGFNPQRATPALIANSLQRVVDARPGWRTVGELPPAVPSRGSGSR